MNECISAAKKCRTTSEKRKGFTDSKKWGVSIRLARKPKSGGEKKNAQAEAESESMS